MTVKAILATKGGEVITIEPTATVETAIGLLIKHRIGALVVVGLEGRVMGILNERNILRALAENGAGVLKGPLSQVMTRKVATCNQCEAVSSIMKQFTAGRFRHVPVVEGDQLIGIVSIGDVVKYRLMDVERESEAMRGYIQTA
jgi:CBS domain-containing protein